MRTKTLLLVQSVLGYVATNSIYRMVTGMGRLMIRLTAHKYTITIGPLFDPVWLWPYEGFDIGAIKLNHSPIYDDPCYVHFINQYWWMNYYYANPFLLQRLLF